MKVPIGDPMIGEDEKNAIMEVLKGDRFTMGPRVVEFEKKWAEYVGVKYGVMVNSGSSANLLMLTAYRDSLSTSKRKGEIIVPAIGWSTTFFPIVQVGMKPVFVDVSHDLNISVDVIERAITPRTRAIVPVHVYGNPAKMNVIREIAESEDLDILEDCCESHGAEEIGRKVGSFGEMGTFSFFASHHITTIEGGMIVTDNPNYADYLRSLRAHGWTREMELGDMIANINGIDPRFCFWSVGYNLRPTEINAAVGLAQLPKLEGWIAQRRANARWYRENLPVEGTFERTNTRHSFMLYTLFSNKKKELMRWLEKNNIETRPVASGNMIRQPVMRNLEFRVSKKLVWADKIDNEAFCIGVHPGVTSEQREYVKQKMDEFLK